MFPNFRLLMAAMFVSVVALICGFGVVAAFHVSHEPLVRLPPATAPLRLLADNGATLPVAAQQPFDHSFQIGEPGVGGGISALAYSAAQPDQQPVMDAVAATADDHEHDASEPAPAPTSADGVDAPTPPQQTAVAEAARDTKPDEAAHEATPDSATAEAVDAQVSAPSVAAIDPATAEAPTEQAHPPEQTTETETAPPISAAVPAPATPETAAKMVETTTKGSRVATKAHRLRRVRAGAIASTQTIKRNFTFSENAFPSTAQGWPPQAQQQPARGQRSRITSTATGEASSAIGGPFVSAPR